MKSYRTWKFIGPPIPFDLFLHKTPNRFDGDMLMKRFLLLLFFQLTLSSLYAQFTVSGSVVDSVENASLPGVNLLLIDKNDSTFLRGTVTDTNGEFKFRDIKRGNYILRLSYIGYATKDHAITVTNDMALRSLKMAEVATTLNALVITGETIPVEQKGDTVQYSAGSYKVNADATAEELIQKMPGITADGTGIKAQGEEVKQVLVDGKRFFGDDATAALKNLPAEIVEKIEVFDRMSEQSQFTGFDDGQAQRTINIVTKRGMNNGQFGRVNAGIAHTGRYIASGNLNSFKGNRKLSILGLSNNINQQNFSNEDLLGVNGGSSGTSRGGRGGSGNNGGNNFLVGQQKGISTTHAAGFNYNNEWNKKAELSASYFFNQSENDQRSDLTRQYIARDSGLLYHETNKSISENTSHRINMRLEYNIDSANSVVFTPRLSLQMNQSRSATGSISSILENTVGELTKVNGADNLAYSLSGNVLYRHRFRKKGRSMSLGLNVDKNNRDGESDLTSVNRQFDPEQLSEIDQDTDNTTSGTTYSTNVAYTEPLGKMGQLQLNYSTSISKNDSDKRTYDILDEEPGATPELNTLLTNVFENTYLANRGGVSYRFNKMRKLNVMAGLNFQHARLSSDQRFPRVMEVDRTFQNLLPQATFNYRVPSGRNVRIQYRTATNAPSVNQLQNVVNNSNPLFLRSGNSTLSQDYQHNLTIRIGNTNVEKGKSFLLFMNGSLIDNYIGNATFLNTGKDSIVINEVDLAPGQQLNYPINIAQNWNARTFVTYGLPVKLIKSNLNLNTGLNYNRTPARINGTTNVAHNYALSQGVVLSSNISKAFDFTLSYTASYNIVNNSFNNRAGGENNYFTHLSTLRVNSEPWKGLVLYSNLTNSLFSGLSADLDQSIWFWNAAVGYKLFKDKSLEVRVQAFDLLNQNKNIGREVTETFIEDSVSNVLTRYFMLNIAYTFRKF